MMSQLLIIVLLGLGLVSAIAGAKVTDISGTWEFSVTLEIERGPALTQTFVFKQQGEKLTGTQPDASGGGDGNVTGTVKGNNVVFSVEGKNSRGNPYKCTYTGTLESSTKMTGAAETPKGSAKWTATKK